MGGKLITLCAKNKQHYCVCRRVGLKQWNFSPNSVLLQTTEKPKSTHRVSWQSRQGPICACIVTFSYLPVYTNLKLEGLMKKVRWPGGMQNCMNSFLALVGSLFIPETFTKWCSANNSIWYFWANSTLQRSPRQTALISTLFLSSQVPQPD